MSHAAVQFFLATTGAVAAAINIALHFVWPEDSTKAADRSSLVLFGAI